MSHPIVHWYEPYLTVVDRYSGTELDLEVEARCHVLRDQHLCLRMHLILDAVQQHQQFLNLH
jgi:hypothetical protein